MSCLFPLTKVGNFRPHRDFPGSSSIQWELCSISWTTVVLVSCRCSRSNADGETTLCPTCLECWIACGLSHLSTVCCPLKRSWKDWEKLWSGQDTTKKKETWRNQVTSETTTNLSCQTQTWPTFFRLTATSSAMSTIALKLQLRTPAVLPMSVVQTMVLKVSACRFSTTKMLPKVRSDYLRCTVQFRLFFCCIHNSGYSLAVCFAISNMYHMNVSVA